MREDALKERKRVDDLKSLLTREQEDKQIGVKALADLQTELAQLKRSNELLRHVDSMLINALYRTDKLSLVRSVDELQAEIKRLRLSEQSARLNHAQLVATVDELKQALASKQLDISKLNHKIEVNREGQEGPLLADAKPSASCHGGRMQDLGEADGCAACTESRAARQGTQRQGSISR